MTTSPQGTYVVRVRIPRGHPNGDARSFFVGEYSTESAALETAERIAGQVDGHCTWSAAHAITVIVPHSLAGLATNTDTDRREVMEHTILWHYLAGRPRAPIAAETGLTRREVGQILSRRWPTKHGLVTTAEVAEHYSITTVAARRLMADHGVRAVTGYPAGLALTVPRPGQGTRTDLATDTEE